MTRLSNDVYWVFPMPIPRHLWPVRIFPLGKEPGDDLSATTTVAERLAMVAVLSERLWRLTGRPVPEYTRSTMPGRVLRPHE